MAESALNAFARSVVERWFFERQAPVELPEGVGFADVQIDSAELVVELDLLEARALGVPAVSIAGSAPIPVALSLIVPPPWVVRDADVRVERPDARELEVWANEVGDALMSNRIPIPGVRPIPPDQARTTFVERASSFLVSRISGASQLRDLGGHRAFLKVPLNLGGEATSIAGCEFWVSSVTQDLTVYWSGGYRLSPHYFNYPTSPTSSTLESGDYVFGVGGRPYPDIQWNLDAVVTLPGQPSVHLNY